MSQTEAIEVSPTTAPVESAKKGGFKEKQKAKKEAKEAAGGVEFVMAPVHGTRDCYPEQMRFRNYLFGTFRNVSRNFGFEEYETPVLERTALWQRKQGEEIVDQLFHFTYSDDGVEQQVCLRPEMTPSLARLVLQKGKALMLPVKWFTVAQCWRLESVQVGRKREHFQWNADIIGVRSVVAESELINAIVSTLEALGLTSSQVRVRVSDRRLLAAACAAVSLPDELFGRACIEVDKVDKVGVDGVRTALTAAPLNMSDEAASVLLEVIKCDSPGAARKVIDAAAAGEAGCSAVSEAEAKKIKTLADAFETNLVELLSLTAAYGFGEYVKFDPSIVRGLAYYTGSVFEVSDTLGPNGSNKFRALAGGGRYDKLLSLYGAKEEVPAVGFGFGDCTIEEVLRDLKLIPSPGVSVEALVIPFEPSLRPAAMNVLRVLRAGGVTADIVMDKKDVKWSFTYADRRGAAVAVFVAPDEVATESARVKSLREGDPDTKDKGDVVKVSDLPAAVKAIVARVSAQ